MLNWQDKIRVCEKLVPTDSHFSEHQKGIIIENVVDSIGPILATKDQSDQ